jgi:hypothetical protein
MLKSRIDVDLPSAETQRGKNPVEWVRSLFGAKLDLRSGREELTVSAFSLVEGLVAGFSRAGVTDVISFIVDKKVVYMDSAEVTDDLGLVLEAAEQKGVLAKKFGQMHLVLSHKEAGLHTLLDVRIMSEVLLGGQEMQVELSSRIEDLRVRAGETAEDYSKRVRGFVENADEVEQYRLRLEALTEKVASGMRASLVGATVTAAPAVVEIIRPRTEQIGRFRNLRFGDEVVEPHYRGVPTHHRVGAYADPFFYYYYDPYYDFMSWVMLDSLMHHQTWHSPYVHFVDTDGYELGTSATLSTVSDGWAGSDAVSVQRRRRDPGGPRHPRDLRGSRRQLGQQRRQRQQRQQR